MALNPSFGDGYAQVKVEIELIDPGSGTGIWDTDVWGTGTWSGVEPDWTEVTSYFLGGSYRRGRDRFIVGNYETGTATILLDNDTGTWTPASGVMSLGRVAIRPGMLIRISERYSEAPDALGDLTASDTVTGFVDGRTWTANGSSIDIVEDPTGWVPKFTGRIMDITDQYDDGAAGAVTRVTAVDFLADLSRFEPGASTPSRSNEDTDARIGYILDEMGWPDEWRDIDTGLFNIEADPLDKNYLTEARHAAAAEGGAIFCGPDGHIVFKQANWLLEDSRSAQVQEYLGTSRLRLIAATPEWSASRIYNQVNYRNHAGTITTQEDTTSQGQYGINSLNKLVPSQLTATRTTLATRDLAILKDDKMVLRMVTMGPLNRFESLFGVTVKIGDLLDVTWTTLQGWSFTQELHVSGIGESWNGKDWLLMLRLDSREGDTVVS